MTSTRKFSVRVMVFLPRIEDRRILLPRPEELVMPFWVTSERGAGALQEYCTVHEVSGPFLDHNYPALVPSISIDVASPCKGF